MKWDRYSLIRTLTGEESFVVRARDERRQQNAWTSYPSKMKRQRGAAVWSVRDGRNITVAVDDTMFLLATIAGATMGILKIPVLEDYIHAFGKRGKN